MLRFATTLLVSALPILFAAQIPPPHVIPASTREPTSCCKKGQRAKAVRVLEHALPIAQQTHEVIYDPHTHAVLVTQMEEGRLVKLTIDEKSGELSSEVQSTLLDVPHRDKDGNPFVGLHGLALSEKFPGHVWCTLQYVNTIVLVDIATLAVAASFACPQTLADGVSTIGGPHSLVEKRGHLYVTMKGGASCHGPPEAGNGVEEATAHGIWRVALGEDGQPRDAGHVFMVAATPPMCAVDEQGDCWVVADAHPSVGFIPFSATPSAEDLTGSGGKLGEPPVPESDEALRAKAKPVFDAVDTDGSGTVSIDEVLAMSRDFPDGALPDADVRAARLIARARSCCSVQRIL